MLAAQLCAQRRAACNEDTYHERKPLHNSLLNHILYFYKIHQLKKRDIQLIVVDFVSTYLIEI
jgi:hypothetical protein